MTTTPPTDADIDAWMDSSTWLPDMRAAVTGGLTPSYPAREIYVIAYTRNDATPVFETGRFGDPADDPCCGMYLAGLVAAYGAVNLRKYIYQFTLPTAADFAASAADQLALNDPAGWAAAP